MVTLARPVCHDPLVPRTDLVLCIPYKRYISYRLSRFQGSLNCSLFGIKVFSSYTMHLLERLRAVALQLAFNNQKYPDTDQESCASTLVGELTWPFLSYF